MSRRLVAAIDQGTTSSRCIIFDEAARPVASAQRPHRQIHPRPGWVEHDAEEIWQAVQHCIAEAVAQLPGGASAIAAIGITNQRETCVVWDRASGKPIHNAIVWQDVRTEPLLASMAEQGGRDRFRASTGLPLASYFSAAKIAWILDSVEGARDAARAGRLAAGTMDSWLIWKLTGRHVTDVTNAHRTQLMDLRSLAWDEALLAAFNVPRGILPEIASSSEIYGEARGTLAGIPVAGALGDQHAALVGQGCFGVGDTKCTYGTGNFLLSNCGPDPVFSNHGLLTTLAYRFGDEPPCYALEGSVAYTGALIQWLRDGLGLIESAAAVEALAAGVEDNGGAVIVPAFAGLFAPHWRPDARGVIAGLTAYVTSAHLARAALEAVAIQTHELVGAVRADGVAAPPMLRVDGGMTANALLMQMQADLLDLPVARARIAETTCLGAAFAAGLATGVWADRDAVRALAGEDSRWQPRRDAAWREMLLHGWRKAIGRSLDWA